MIVVEGPDGSGKSTLVKQICQEFDLREGSRGTSNRDLLYTVTLPDTMRALACAVQGHREPYVWDRLYYSDFVYAPVQKRAVAFNLMHQRHINKMITVLGCPRIMCLPPQEVVVANALKVHQMDGVKENIEGIHQSYRRVLLTLDFMEGHPWAHYDYTTHDIEPLLHSIELYINKRKDRQP